MSCSYCSTPTIEGLSIRQRSPESVVSWIERWVKEGFRHFYFVDNTFNLPSSYAMQLCSKIIEAGLDISWRCILFPGGITLELVERLGESSFAHVRRGDDKMLVVEVRGRETPAVSEPVTFRAPLQDIHVFDTSGKRIDVNKDR